MDGIGGLDALKKYLEAKAKVIGNLSQALEFGTYLIRNLAKEIEPEYGSGFSVRQLEMCRKFYRTYPIASALRTQLNWSQYKLLIAISDSDKREYYQLEAVYECWTKRQLERQVNSMLYERLLLSNDKEAVLAVARKERVPESPQEIIKDPMVLEFLGLEKKASYYEKDLESAIISILQISCLKWERDSLLWLDRKDFFEIKSKGCNMNCYFAFLMLHPLFFFNRAYQTSIVE